MKIGVIAHLNHPIGAPFKGGLERFTYNLVKKLEDKGHDVILFASGDSDSSLNLLPIVPKSFCCEREEADEFNEYLKTKAYLSLVDSIHKYDLDIVHNNSLSSACLTELGIPTITSIHTPPFGKFKFTVAKAPHYFTFVSRYCYRDWALYLGTQDVSIIYNGVDLSEWQFNSSPEENKAIWFGRIHPDKAPHYAIQAALNAGMNIDVIGPISNKKYFEKWIKMWFRSTSVQYKGHLEGNDLIKAVGNASVFINSPLWEEPCGLTFLESLACGTPVATYRSGSATEIISPNTGIVCDQNSIDVLTKAANIAKTFNREDCRQYAEQRWNVNVMIDKYIQLYRDVTK